MQITDEAVHLVTSDIDDKLVRSTIVDYSRGLSSL